MELKVIDRLIEKYFDAETSLQEEATLREYFCSGNVAPHLQEYIPLFNYFETSKKENYPGKVIIIEGKKEVYSWVAVAASVILAAGLFFQQPNEVNEFGSYEDPEMALEKTKEALQMVSLLMNNGTQDLMYLQEFNNATEKIKQ